MKGRGKYGPYLAAGVTAFAVIAAAILLFFLLEHFSAIRSLLETIGYILRPICYGIVLAFLLLPVHRRILAVLTDQCQGIRDPWGKKKNILSAISILLSLIFAFLVLYVLLAMVLPQLYWSLVGLFEALPGYFQSVQQWLTTFLADNPDIQQAVLSYYRTAGAALNQWLSSDLIPNLESASSTLAWLRSELLPQLTGVVSGVSTVVLALVNLLKDIIVAVIVSVYLLARKDVFAAQSKKILYSIFPTRAADLLVEESRSAYRILSGFINGTLVDSFIVGVICLICFTVFQFPYPMLLAVIIGVTNVIPDSGQLGGAGLLLGAVCGAAVRWTVRLCGHGTGRACVRHVLQRGQPPGEPRPEKAGPAPEYGGVPGKDRPAGAGKDTLPAGAGRNKRINTNVQGRSDGPSLFWLC